MDTLLEHNSVAAFESNSTDKPVLESDRVLLLEQFGNQSMSYSTLQPQMQYFDIPGIGFIAYRDCWGERIALSDLMCALHMKEFMLNQFMKTSPKSTTFVQISEDTAQLLASRFGMYCTDLQFLAD